MSKRFCRQAVGAALLLFWLEVAAGGQLTSGAADAIAATTGVMQSVLSDPMSAIAGSVSDPMGIGIPQARVTVIDETGESRYQTATSCGGQYLRRLPAGNYSAHIEANAFRPHTEASIRVTPYLVTQLDAVLQVGAFSGSEIEAGERPPRGTIAGIVKDANGGAPIFAKIAALKTTGERFEATTDSYGVYLLAGLPAGSYEVSFVAGENKTGAHWEALVQPSAPVCLDALGSSWAGIQVLVGPIATAEDAEDGAITGYVSDPAAAVIPGAQVTATEESTTRMYSTTTNDSGLYRLSPLTPGKYTVRYEMKGFKTVARTSVIINQSQVARIDVRLTIGSYSGPEITPNR